MALLSSLAAMLFSSKAVAASTVSADWALCTKAIQAVERVARTPPKLLQAIGLVESGRADETFRLVAPWPWTINAGSQGQFFRTQQDAIAAVQTLQARGIRSIDVGCMQVNLLQHPDAFPSLDLAFDPQINVAYAARFLGQLHQRLGDWPHAAAAYHSQTPAIGAAYGRRVMALWPHQAIVPDSAAQIDSAIYTPEFARRLAQDAADRAARDAGLLPRVQGASPPSRSSGIYTPEFAAHRARDEAERARRLAALRGVVPTVEVGEVAHRASNNLGARHRIMR